MSYDASANIWIEDSDAVAKVEALESFVAATDADHDAYWWIESDNGLNVSISGQSFDSSHVLTALAPIAKKFGVTFGVSYHNDLDDDDIAYVGPKADVCELRDLLSDAADAAKRLRAAIKRTPQLVDEALDALLASTPGNYDDLPFEFKRGKWCLNCGHVHLDGYASLMDCPECKGVAGITNPDCDVCHGHGTARCPVCN